jgi:hypothetical protein
MQAAEYSYNRLPLKINNKNEKYPRNNGGGISACGLFFQNQFFPHIFILWKNKSEWGLAGGPRQIYKYIYIDI